MLNKELQKLCLINPKGFHKDKILEAIEKIQNNKPFDYKDPYKPKSTRSFIYDLYILHLADNYIMINETNGSYVVDYGVGCDGGGGDYYYNVSKEELLEFLDWALSVC